MKMILNRLQVENFKGIKKFDGVLDGADATIKAANGVGKTTVYDAFLWLLFGKDSTGRKDFDLRPLDNNNQAIAGLTLLVAAEIEIDGVSHIFRKQHEEKVVKGQLRGFETLCWIDDVPKKVGEFQEYISDIIPEDTFKLLTSIRHFNEGLHWTDRRSVLLEIAGEVGHPEGYDHLLSQLKGRSIDDYKKVLADQKKRLTKERDEINPRIDELQRGLDSYADTKPELSTALKRSSVQAELSKIDARRNELLASETARQSKIDQLNRLKNQQAAREMTLANDTGSIKHLLNEKSTIEQGIANKQQTARAAAGNLYTAESSIVGEKQRLDSLLRSLNDIREEYNLVSVQSEPGTCSLCGQQLPAEKLAEINQRKDKKLAEIINRGNQIKQAVDAQKQKITSLEADIPALKESVERANIELKEAEAYKSERFAAIDNLVKHNKTTPPDQDAIWQDLSRQIETLTGQIGEPMAKQLETIEAERRATQGNLDALNRALAQADRVKQDSERIKELEAKEKEIAQQIADVDGLLASIDSYNTAESKLIEAAVNDRFKLVNFKLFNQLLNGNIDPACEATLNGVPYGDMSYGQKIVVGIDIINVLAEHYGYSVPLFVDNAESLTLAIESNSQTICLMAQKNVKKLTITTDNTSKDEPEKLRKKSTGIIRTGSLGQTVSDLSRLDNCLSSIGMKHNPNPLESLNSILGVSDDMDGCF